MSVWAHLPNAKHINLIINDLIESSFSWGDLSNSDAWSVAWHQAWNVIRRDNRESICWDACKVVKQRLEADDSHYSSNRISAILALIAYDDCAYLLDEKPEHVKTLALLGNHAAILLYPICVAMQKEIL